MLLLLEGIAMCFLLLFLCAVGIANGPAGLVVFYEKDVQERVVALGYTTKEKIKRRFVAVSIALFAPTVLFVPLMVYGVNNAVGFWDAFGQMTVIFWIMGLFDRVFIDWYWVGHTKAWIIPGTEDLQPYIPAKTLIKKWIGTIMGFPMMAAVIAGIMALL